jgi:hypothetical protein
MVLLDQHLPLRLRQAAYAFPADAGRIEYSLMARFAIGIHARIDRIGQHMVDGRVTRFDPADIRTLVHLQRETVPLRTQPQPDAAR